MGESNLWKFLDHSDITGYTFIIPSVAVGNLGQLTCDLLISSLNMVKIASVYSRAFIPVLGYDPYDLKSSSLSSCCEIYKCDQRNVVVLQIRAPLVYKYARSFLEDVVQKFREKNIKDIIILTSSFAHEMKHVSTSPFRYVISDYHFYSSKVNELNWIKHESLSTSLKIYGGGFASILYEIVTAQSLPCLILFKYCSEGNNIPEAHLMVSVLANLMPIFSEDIELNMQLAPPASWKLLFGRPPPVDIY